MSTISPEVMPLNLLPMVKHALHQDRPGIYRLAHSEDIVCRIKIALTVYNFVLDETELLVIFNTNICNSVLVYYIRSFKRYINVLINFRKLRLPFFFGVSSFLLTATSAR
jgi:hypothetical protein